MLNTQLPTQVGNFILVRHGVIQARTLRFSWNKDDEQAGVAALSVVS
jgi:hypothetical protein